MTDKFAVIDFETTGLSPQQGDRAIEIGIVLFDGTQVIETYQSLMNPGVSVSPFIEELTGINQTMVEQARASSIVIREACEVIGDLPVVAHNASFDRKFFISELSRIGKSYSNPFLCTMLIGRRLYPLSLNHKLATLATLNKINTEGHHRALADAVMTSKLLGVMRQDLKELYENQIIDSQFLRSYQKKPKSSVRSCDRKPSRPPPGTRRSSRPARPYRRPTDALHEPLEISPTNQETPISDQAKEVSVNQSKPVEQSGGGFILWMLVVIGALFWLVN